MSATPGIVERLTAALDRPSPLGHPRPVPSHGDPTPDRPITFTHDGVDVVVSWSEVPGQRHVAIYRPGHDHDDLSWIAGGSFSDACDDLAAVQLLIEAW